MVTKDPVVWYAKRLQKHTGIAVSSHVAGVSNIFYTIFDQAYHRLDFPHVSDLWVNPFSDDMAWLSLPVAYVLAHGAVVATDYVVREYVAKNLGNFVGRMSKAKPK